jgi:hypothetical protein
MNGIVCFTRFSVLEGFNATIFACTLPCLKCAVIGFFFPFAESQGHSIV